MRPPTVAIVGVPNVGKSTLFNRLVGRRRALVGPRPGITRDRIHAEVEAGGRRFTLIDTGGIFAGRGTGLSAQVRLQAGIAVEEATVILLVTSARDGLTPADQELAEILRASGRTVIPVVNKVDHDGLGPAVAEFYALGLGDPIAVSAEHGLGMSDLRERVGAALPEAEVAPAGPGEVRKLAIVGRPNVGKSSLLNALCREERSIVSPAAGTTRDTVDLVLESDGRRYRMLDTAGIRRAARTPDPIDRLSTLRATTTLQGGDVALVVVDGSEGITSQDKTVAGLARRFCRPLVLVVNKWDLAPPGDEARERFRRELDRAFRFARYAPALFVSARTGAGLDRLLPMVERVWGEGATWIQSARLNRFLRTVDAHHTARDRVGKPLRCYYVTQTGAHPPAFTIFTNSSAPVHFAFRRFVENRLRQEFRLKLTPIVIHWRRK